MSFTTAQMKLMLSTGQFQNIYPACAKQGRVTLSAFGWTDDKIQAIPVNLTLMTNFAGWSPAFSSLEAYKNAGILLIEIGEASLVFSAETIPDVDIEINIISL